MQEGKPPGEDRIRVLLVDDEVLFRESLSRYLAEQPGFEVAGECGSAAEAQELLKTLPADVVLLNFDFGTKGGKTLLAAARHAGYRGQFLIVAGKIQTKDLAAALKLGAAGVFLKSDVPERLVEVIRIVAGGAAWVDPSLLHLLADKLAQPADDREPSRPLTERQEAVLQGILRGLTNLEIANQIGVSEGTVKAVVQGLFRRSGVRTRAQLVREALDGSFGGASATAKRRQNRTAVDVG
jgi:two-component system, NarL family, nitrate/nitrite response regulator NarL